MCFYLITVFSVAVALARTENPATNNVVTQGICRKGYFQCVNDTLCIHQNSQCNGKEDCPNGSDEFDCNDSNDDDYWDHLWRKSLSAESDEVDKKSCDFLYKGSCKCVSRNIFCHHKQLEKIPENIKNMSNEFIEILDFTGNNFKILDENTLENIPNNVIQLSLAHCNIHEINKKSFYKLSNIRELFLDNNNIKKIPKGVFNERNYLTKLFLTYNDISTIHKEAFKHLDNLMELDLRGNKLEKVSKETFEQLENLRFLFLQNNRIRYIGGQDFFYLPLETLSLVENKIKYIESGAFGKLYTLKTLYLSNNDLKELKNGTFKNLTYLQSLTLNDNFISNIETNVFADVPNLVSLRLELNQFRSLNEHVLKPLTKLENIYFDRFEMCALTTFVRVCHPQGDGISSYKHLLDDIGLRTWVWVMATIGYTGNTIVLLGRCFMTPNNIVHSLYLRNLALSDLLMGIYLFIIASVDQYYRDVYLKYEYVWRHGFLCSLCGFLSTLSCESSVLILTLVTWDRFVSVTQPLARKQMSSKTASLTLSLLWISAILMSFLPLLTLTESYFGNEFYGNNGVCLGLHIHEPFSMGWEYSVVIYVVINSIALIFICYAYLKMAAEIRASSLALRSTRQISERDRVAQRFGVIVLTDCLCWAPIIAVKICALCGIKIPDNLYAWLAIFILPINSALNPILYTLTTSVFKKQILKILNSWMNMTRHDANHPSASESAFSLTFGGFPSHRRVLSYRGTQSSLTTSKNNSCKRSTAV